jgi:hypothetical protein
VSGLAIRWVDAAGYIASVLVFATFCMRTMIALRVAAIGSNICFIGFGLAAHVYPVLLLHVVLLPLNTLRTLEMVRLTRRIEVAAKGDLSFDPIKPFMKAEQQPVIFFSAKAISPTRCLSFQQGICLSKR